MWFDSGFPGLSERRRGTVVVWMVVGLLPSALPVLAQRPLGIDVSAYQGNLGPSNWSSIYNSGRRFAFIRITHYGVPNGDPDLYYAQNMANARAAGLLVGPYHYAIWTRTPQVEADYFLQYARPYITSGYLPPMLDLETKDNSDPNTGTIYPPAGASSVCDWARQWLARVEEETGVVGGVYVSGSYINRFCKTSTSCSCGGCDCCLINHPLWVADWCGNDVCTACGDINTAQPEFGTGFYPTWRFWQYCSKGSVPGIAGNCDLDVFNGTLAELQAMVIDFPTPSSVQAVSITQTGATILWNTPRPASSQVQYGLTTAYGYSTPVDSTLKTFHSVTLTGLVSGMTYHFRVISTDSDNQTGTSADYTFTTVAPVQIDIDNTYSNCIKTGSWTTSTSGAYMIGVDYLTTNPVSGSATATCRWVPTIPSAGTYDVYVYYQQAANRNTAVPYTIVYNGGTLNLIRNQYALAPTGSWFKLNTSPLPFAAGTGGYVQVANNSEQSGVIVADAARFVWADAQAPTAPANLNATAISTSAIQLNWSPATDNSGVVGYKIYRNGVAVGTINTTSYLDAGLEVNTTWSYQVAAYDAVPNESALSSPAVNCSTLSTPPDAASIVPDRTSGCVQATVTWTATGGFGPGAVHHYRYAWNQNPTHDFTGSEPQWSTGTLQTVMSASGAWYLHVQGCNADDVANGAYTYSVEAGDMILGDLDGNCRVDGVDVTLFRNCLGQAGVTPAPGCESRDLDNDSDVDQDDFGILQRSFSSN